MDIIDIELLNKHYRNKERKEFDSFNFKMQKKKRMRLSNRNKKPLSKYEEFLFDDKDLFNNSSLECTGFYKSNSISHVLFSIKKMQLDDFYNEAISLNSKYPTKGFFGSTIMDEQNKNSFLTITSPNRFGMQRLCSIEPTDSNLIKYIRTIVISAFGISYDSACIDFQIIYSDSFLEQFNKLLVSNFDVKNEYKRTYINGKLSITKCYPSPETAKAQYADDVLFEIKSRVIDFVNNNFSVFNNGCGFLCSVDEYRTNLQHDDRFINCFGYTSLFKKDLIDYSYFNDKSELKNGHLLLNYQDSIKHPFYKLQRGRMLYIVESDEYTYNQQSLDFCLMFFVQKNEIDNFKETLNKKYALFEKMGTNRYCCISKIFKQYAKLCLQANNSLIILDSGKLKYFSNFSDSTHLKSLLEYIKEETKRFDLRNKDLDEKINNVLSSKNNASSIKIAVIALIASSLSTVATIVTIILSLVYKT